MKKIIGFFILGVTASSLKSFYLILSTHLIYKLKTSPYALIRNVIIHLLQKKLI